MPVVFDDVDRFRAWFARMDDAGALESDRGRELLIDEQRRHRIVSKLHDVLRPFLLRRTKLEVFGSGRQSSSPSSSSSSPSSSSSSTTTLPPKREITLSTPLTAFQRKLYAYVLDRALAAANANSSASDSSSSSLHQSAPAINIMVGGKTAISLQNVLMQLRLICCHPYLLVDHADESHGADIEAARALWLSLSASSSSLLSTPLAVASHSSYRAQEDADYLCGMIAVSAKLQMLHRLLAALRADGHKVLIFSQFTRSLDIIQGKHSHAYLLLLQHELMRIWNTWLIYPSYTLSFFICRVSRAAIHRLLSPRRQHVSRRSAGQRCALLQCCCHWHWCPHRRVRLISIALCLSAVHARWGTWFESRRRRHLHSL